MLQNYEMPEAIEPIPNAGEQSQQEHDSLLHRISDIYFAPKFFESEKLYETLGVRGIKNALMKLGSVYSIHDFSTEGLQTIETLGRIYEGFHLTLGVIAGGNALLHPGDFNSIPMGFIAVAATAVNGALIPVQRYNRLRLTRLIERRKARG